MSECATGAAMTAIGLTGGRRWLRLAAVWLRVCPVRAPLCLRLTTVYSPLIERSSGCHSVTSSLCAPPFESPSWLTSSLIASRSHAVPIAVTDACDDAHSNGSGSERSALLTRHDDD